jgi:hypothetical protein
VLKVTYRRVKGLRLLIALALPALLILAACEDGGEDESSPSPTSDPSATATGDAEYCNEQAVSDVVDLWVDSVAVGLAKTDDLTLDDEDGMRNDIEAATLTYCEAGQFPPPEAVEAYCNAIVAAIDFRLDGPNDSRNAFLTDYYDRCYQLDDAEPTPTG